MCAEWCASEVSSPLDKVSNKPAGATKRRPSGENWGRLKKDFHESS